MDAIDLDLTVCCIVGILPRERIEPQRLRIVIHMELDLERTASTGDLEASVDYGAVDTIARFVAVEGQFRLIESMGLALLRVLLLPPGPGELRAPILRAAIELHKPDVLLSAAPSVRLTRDERWAAHRKEISADTTGRITEILSLPELEIAHLELPAGAPAPRALGNISSSGLLGLGGVYGRQPSPFVAPCPCTLLRVMRR